MDLSTVSTDDLRSEAHAYTRVGKFDDAIILINEVISRGGARGTDYNTRGHCNYLSLRLAEAHSDFSKAVKLDPDNALAYNNRGGTFRDQKDFKRAMSDFEKAIELDPDECLAVANRGTIYFCMKEFDRAIADLTVYLESEETDYRGVFGWTRGLCYCFLEDYESASDDFVLSFEADRTYRMMEYFLPLHGLSSDCIAFLPCLRDTEATRVLRRILEGLA